MEKSPQEFTPGPDNFDAWLTNLDDQELLRVIGVADQAFTDKIEDEAGFAQLIELSMRFNGQPAMKIEEIQMNFGHFCTQLAAERLVREGNAMKDGEYTLAAGKQMPHVWLTEKGIQEREKGQ